MTTTLYKNAIIASQREFKFNVSIYFDGINNSPSSFDETEIESITLLEETFAESQTPLGAVSSNELTLSLLNTNNRFSPKNISSPYYGKLVPNIKIEASVGIKIADGSYEYIDLGEFWTTDWVAPTNSIMASVVCNDVLFNTFNKPMPQIPIQENLTINSMFNILFTVMGFLASDIDVDNISYGLVIGWWDEGGTIRDGLQTLTERGLCNVFVNRTNKVRVIRNNNTESSSFTWSDSNMIVSMELPQEYQKIFSEIDIIYHLPFVDIQSSVLTIEKITIPAGGITISNILFNSVVGDVENIKLIGAVNSSMELFTIGAKSISITFANTGDDEDVNIEIMGRLVTMIDAKYVKIDTAAQAIVGNIKFEFNNEYMQSKNDAIAYAEKILPLVINPSNYAVIESRGDPSLLLTNSLLVNNITDDIIGLEVIPIRAQYIFSSGVSCTVNVIKKSIRDLM